MCDLEQSDGKGAIQSAVAFPFVSKLVSLDARGCCCLGRERPEPAGLSARFYLRLHDHLSDRVARLLPRVETGEKKRPIVPAQSSFTATRESASTTCTSRCTMQRLATTRAYAIRAAARPEADCRTEWDGRVSSCDATYAPPLRWVHDANVCLPL